MSILRRKGKQFKDRRGVGKDKATRFNYELLSGDIQTLLQVFHDEANGGEVSCFPSTLKQNHLTPPPYL